jgi:hypothetical protein
MAPRLSGLDAPGILILEYVKQMPTVFLITAFSTWEPATFGTAGILGRV